MGLPTPLFSRWSKFTVDLLDATGTSTGAVVEYQCHVTQVGLVSSGGDLTSLTTLCPDGSFSEANARTWSLDGTAVQDVESTEAFMLFLMDHEGEKAKVTYYPKTDKTGTPVGRGWEGEVTLTLPDTIGNTASGNYATFGFSLPFQGKPQPIDATGAPIVVGRGTVTPPAVVPITDVTAGQPGSFTPSTATVPADLATLKADATVGDAAWAAATTAAWATTGDYVELGDTSHAWWDGSTWTVGEVA